MKDLRPLWRANRVEMSIAAGLVLLTLALYAPVRHFDFVNFDDTVYVILNRHVNGGLTWENLRWAFTHMEGSNWIPLTWISLMADVQCFGKAAGPHHVTNVVLHVLSTLLLFRVLKRMTGAVVPAGAVAFLFAVHPLHVESVAWVTERKDVLSGLFWMLALGWYARYAESRKPVPYLLTLLFYALGFMAKPMVVTLPAILLLLDVWPLRRISLDAPREALRSKVARTLIWEKAPLLVLAVGMSLVTFLVQSKDAVRTLDAYPLGLRLGNAVVSLVVYLWKTIWPSRLAVFYPLLGAPPAWEVAASGVVLLGVTAVAWKTLRSRPYVAVGWLWCVVALLPVIGVIQVGEQARADRYMYLPGIGLFLVLVWGAADVWQRRPKSRPAWIAIGCAAGVALAVLTARQVSYWRNSKTLFEHASQVTENNYIAYGSLGEVLRAEGRYEEALAQYRRALEIDPIYLAAMINYGAVLGSLGRIEEAIVPLRKAARLKPDDPDVHFGYGLALAMQGRLNQAEEQFDIAIMQRPDYVEAHIQRGATMGNLGRTEDAIAEFSEALRLQPDSVEARANLQKALAIRDRRGK